MNMSPYIVLLSSMESLSIIQKSIHYQTNEFIWNSAAKARVVIYWLDIINQLYMVCVKFVSFVCVCVCVSWTYWIMNFLLYYPWTSAPAMTCEIRVDIHNIVRIICCCRVEQDCLFKMATWFRVAKWEEVFQASEVSNHHKHICKGSVGDRWSLYILESSALKTKKNNEQLC